MRTFMLFLGIIALAAAPYAAKAQSFNSIEFNDSFNTKNFKADAPVQIKVHQPKPTEASSLTHTPQAKAPTTHYSAPQTSTAITQTIPTTSSSDYVKPKTNNAISRYNKTNSFGGLENADVIRDREARQAKYAESERKWKASSKHSSTSIGGGTHAQKDFRYTGSASIQSHDTFNENTVITTQPIAAPKEAKDNTYVDRGTVKLQAEQSNIPTERIDYNAGSYGVAARPKTTQQIQKRNDIPDARVVDTRSYEQSGATTYQPKRPVTTQPINTTPSAAKKPAAVNRAKAPSPGGGIGGGGDHIKAHDSHMLKAY